MDPLREPDIRDLSHGQLLALEGSLLRRRPPASMIAGAGVRPDRRPWSYREIWRLEAIQAELARRALR
jgi:hypothetical protein